MRLLKGWFGRRTAALERPPERPYPIEGRIPANAANERGDDARARPRHGRRGRALSSARRAAGTCGQHSRGPIGEPRLVLHLSRASRGSRSLRRRRRDPRCGRRHRGYRAGTPPAGELLGGCARDVQGRGAVDLALDQSMRAEALARRDGQPVLVILVARRLRGRPGQAAAPTAQGAVAGTEVRDSCDIAPAELPSDAPADWMRSVTCNDPLEAEGSATLVVAQRTKQMIVAGGAAGVCRLTRRASAPPIPARTSSARASR